MKKIWQSLLTSSAIFAAIANVGTTALANEISAATESQTESNSAIVNPEVQIESAKQDRLMAQVTSVSQLSDVQPTDWAFQALQSLVERYGCIAGYPNSTYRGNRALTRYEFAAGLNACLDRVNELIATATADAVTKEDIVALERLQEEFSAELATLRGRVDAVEARTAELEANQFSTTSKLEGELVVGITDVFEGNTNDDNTALGARARINFVSSFTGKDTLYTRIQTNNIVAPDLGTPEGGLAFAGDTGDNDAALDALWYSFPLTEKTNVIAIANAGAADDVVDTVNLFDGDGTEGALSTFGTRNPIYGAMDGSGVGVTQEFGKGLSLSLAYLAGSASDPSTDNGLFQGSYGALAQLTLEPSDRFKIGLTYINSYNQFGGAGSNAATLNVTSPVDNATNLADTPYSSNSYGVQASLGLSKNLVLGGWAGYSNVRNLSTSPAFPDRGKADVWNWAVTLGLPDLGKKGNLGGIIFGMEPKVTDSSIDGLNEDSDTSYHIEAFYQYKVNDNISVTPGVIWLTAPDHNSNNDDIVIGTFRTTFTF
ncbi:iron uptake porin [Mastigocoleus sp. MO_188.B34]|uniref:iron uptake porin n=1 Tax=Mastigocoleus sp. MO_188.B34 TaxID=3036635 RepID=UPI0026328014|nr:iron uptake porin [Mastigocoleus sp. MO_188.B34]MDJ0695252.1 iron uptake porin [Mastigocoleus sp. MO_188.B34]